MPGSPANLPASIGVMCADGTYLLG